MSITAMKQALEALERSVHELRGITATQDMTEAITSLRQAIANEALDKKAENARELGLDYYIPCCKDQTCQKCVAAKQEPLAYINVEQRKLEWAKYMKWETPTVVNLPKIPLYTTPQPQREWVGLTDEEIAEAIGDSIDDVYFADFRKVIAKLKKKNS